MTTIEIDFRFTTPTGEYEGAFVRDYFGEDGYRRALAAPTEAHADRILSETYLGPDDDGVGVVWCGERVEAGEGDDHDAGRILGFNGRMALVAWQSGVRTPCPIVDLAPAADDTL